MELFLDGQHHYATAQIAKKWTAVYNGSATGIDPTVWSIVAEGRTANCLKQSWVNLSNANPGFVTVAPLVTNYGPWTPTDSGVCGFAVKVSDLTKVDTNPIGNARYFFAYYEGGGPVFHVALNTNGTFSCYYYTEAALDNGYVGSSIQGIRSDTWAYVEFKWTIDDDPDGQFQIYLNSVKVYDMQTQPGIAGRRKTTAGFSSRFSYTGVWESILLFALRPTSTTFTLRMCDFYLADQETHSTDYVVHDVLGDRTIGAIYPNGAGAYSEWTPLSGNNFDNVKEHPPDDDTSYVSGATSGLKDRYQMDDVPAGAVILGYQSLVYAKKTSPGLSLITPVLRVGGVDYTFTPQAATSPDTYYYIIQPHDNNPATGAQATEADIDAIEAGFDKA